MSARQQFLLDVVVGLCANSEFMKTTKNLHQDFEKAVREQANKIVNEIFYDD